MTPVEQEFVENLARYILVDTRHGPCQWFKRCSNGRVAPLPLAWLWAAARRALSGKQHGVAKLLAELQGAAPLLTAEEWDWMQGLGSSRAAQCGERLTGRVSYIAASYCFLRSDWQGTRYFAPERAFPDGVFSALRPGDRLSWELNASDRGRTPAAKNIQLFDAEDELAAA